MHDIFVYMIVSLCVDVFLNAGDVLRFIHHCAWRMTVVFGFCVYITYP
jgi:hypothetical protein